MAYARRDWDRNGKMDLNDDFIQHHIYGEISKDDDIVSGNSESSFGFWFWCIVIFVFCVYLSV